MKKIIASLVVCSISLGAFAWHGHGWGHCGWRGGHHYYHPHGYYHHGSYWGRGGCHFWPGFVGGVVGGAIASAVVDSYVPPRTVVVQPTQPVVVQQPVVQQPVVVQQPIVVQNPLTVVTTPQVTQKVWIEGRYVDRLDSNGNVVRVWEPGHFEYR